MFNFTWMALEQAINEIAPAFKGSAGARGRNAFVLMPADGVDLNSPLNLAWRTAVEAGDMSADIEALIPIRSSANQFEVAFELVRRIRNAFAHGDITPPEPLDWGQGKPPPANPEVDRFFAATRLALLLLTQLLSAPFASLIIEPSYEDPACDELDDEPLEEVSAQWCLLTAHLLEPGSPSPSPQRLESA